MPFFDVPADQDIPLASLRAMEEWRRVAGAAGFDEATLDSMCANPDTLPLDPRGRRFVRWALRLASDAPGLTLADFRAMAADGFSPEEVQDILGSSSSG